MRKRKTNSNFRTLPAALLAGCAIVGIANSVQAEEIELIQKTPETRNFDYSNDSYKINIPIENLGTSENIRWTQLDTEPDADAQNTISVNISENDKLYYSYEYIPHGYKIINEVPDSSFDLTNINNVLFQDISTDSSAFGILYTIKDKPEIDIKADFINNKVENKQEIIGGAISNTGKIGNITGDFVNNVTKSSAYDYSSVYGGNIFNKGTINKITGDFINNEGYSYGSQVNGVAIYNRGTINNITGSFINNNSVSFSTQTNGAAIYNHQDGVIGNLYGNFVNNKIKTFYGRSSSGGAIYNGNIIGDINSNFINNATDSPDSSSLGGGIANIGSIVNISGDFVNNYAVGYENVRGGAIYNEGTIGDISGDFSSNYASAGYDNVKGGAIYNEGSIGTKDSDGKVIGGLVNTNFIGNYTKSETGTAKGGAIYTSTDLNIIADNGTSTFKGNYTQSGEEKDDNAIYVADGATLSFKLSDNGQIAMYDNIRGESRGPRNLAEENEQYTPTYSVNIQGDGSNTIFYMYNDIHNADVSVGNTTLNTANNEVYAYNFNSFTVNSDTNFVVDVDLLNKEMDRITANSYGEHHGNLNVVGMNLLNEPEEFRDYTAIYFAQPELKNNVTHNGLEVPNHTYQNFEAYTPIYKYNVTYDTQNEYDDKGDGGYFLFTKGDKYFRPSDLDPEDPTIPITPGGNTGNPSDAFNPAVLSSPVSSVAAAQATINETFKYVFEHADAFTQLPNVERMARINANKYALYDGASTDFNGNRGSLCYDHNNKAAWFRPYATFETMNLKNGPKVDAITYGSLAGFDTDFHEHKHGWYSVGTGYIGYNGSQLSYKGVDTTMNGGVLGYTHTMYKGNFWTALTLSAGASVGESRTMYGKEDFTSLMAGVGSKTGYNFEFKEGKYILQPIMFMSYTFVNTFDYTNAAGVKINADPAHSIQLNPSIRFISNFKNGWQPYASVGMVWNVMNENNVTANNVRLPEMSMKPYVEYGVGVQRNWKDKFTAFGQAMLRNGGRNGIALTAGFRWALGKDTPHNHDKVEAPKTDRTVLKQLTPQQKMALIGKKNTTITSAKAVLKQL